MLCVGNDLHVITPRAFPLKSLAAATDWLGFIALDLTFPAR